MSQQGQRTQDQHTKLTVLLYTSNQHRNQNLKYNTIYNPSNNKIHNCKSYETWTVLVCGKLQNTNEISQRKSK